MGSDGSLVRTQVDAMNHITDIDTVVPFVTGDGLLANVTHVVRTPAAAAPTRDPVLLVHGAGVRGNIFRAPVDQSLVDALLDEGFDVWLENWRASIDLRPNQWNLDKAAVWDHPAAVRTVLDRTGADYLRAVVHCQGSTSFMMAAAAGLLPEVRTIVSNTVSLHPVVPSVTRWKSAMFHRPLHTLTKYIDPQWGIEAPNIIAEAIFGWVKLVHHECTNTVCRMVSFTYGVGKPTLWSHSLLNPDTHEWLKAEFGPVPMTFFDQMNRCIRAGHLVTVDKFGNCRPHSVSTRLGPTPTSCSSPESATCVSLPKAKNGPVITFRRRGRAPTHCTYFRTMVT